MSTHELLSRADRVVGGALALAWLGMGLVGILVAVSASSPLLGVIGAAAVGYGILWVRVARRGRLLTMREALTPWRRDQDLED